MLPLRQEISLATCMLLKGTMILRVYRNVSRTTGTAFVQNLVKKPRNNETNFQRKILEDTWKGLSIFKFAKYDLVSKDSFIREGTLKYFYFAFYI